MYNSTFHYLIYSSKIIKNILQVWNIQNVYLFFISNIIFNCTIIYLFIVL